MIVTTTNVIAMSKTYPLVYSGSSAVAVSASRSTKTKTKSKHDILFNFDYKKYIIIILIGSTL